MKHGKLENQHARKFNTTDIQKIQRGNQRRKMD